MVYSEFMETVEKDPEVRSRQVHVPVNDAEYDAIRKLAEQTAQPMAAVIRKVVMGYEPPDKVQIQAVRELIKAIGDVGRVGGLLKEYIVIAKDRGWPDESYLHQVVAKIEDLADAGHTVIDRLKDKI